MLKTTNMESPIVYESGSDENSASSQENVNLKTAKREHDPEDKENECRKFGSILNAIPTILERVLIQLPMRDLNRCSQVCKAWNQLSRTVKRKRRTLFWMFWAAKRRKLPPSVCSSCSITEHVRQVLETVSSEPKLGILFITNSFFEVQSTYTDDSKSETAVIDYLVSALPRDCLLLGTCSSGMVGTTLGVNKHCCVEVETTEGFSCLMLPDIPEMDIYPFIIKHEEDLAEHTRKEYLSDEELHSLVKVPIGKEVKSLILFCSHVSEGESGARLVAHTLLKNQNFKLALGGAFVDTFVAPQNMLSPQMYSPHTMGLCICGDKVQASSVVIQTSVTKRKAVEKILERLKPANYETKNSFALMFACVGRGYEHYGERNVEADVFQKLYPKTPLFGLFGNGEIGYEYLPHGDPSQAGDVLYKKVCNSTEKAKKAKMCQQFYPKIFHGYTTIFVMVSVEK